MRISLAGDAHTVGVEAARVGSGVMVLEPLLGGVQGGEIRAVVVERMGRMRPGSAVTPIAAMQGSSRDRLIGTT